MNRVFLTSPGSSPGIGATAVVYADDETSSVGSLRNRGFKSVSLRFGNGNPFTLNTYVKLFHTDIWRLYDTVAVAAASASVKNIFTFNLAELELVKFEAVGGVAVQSIWYAIIEAYDYVEGGC